MRLLLTQHRIELLCIPLICIQLLISANQSWIQSLPICYCFEILATFVITNVSFSDFSVALGRLFYVHQDTAQAYIAEDSFFSGVSTLHVIYSGNFVAMSLGESFFKYSDSHTTFAWYSFCSNKPFIFEERSFSYSLQIAINMLIYLTTLVSHILYFHKKRQIEQRSDEVLVANFNLEDGVTITRRMEAQPSSNYLRNFQRTVVAPKASLVVFIVGMIYRFVLIFFYIIMSTTGLSIGGQFILFVTFCKIFFLDSFLVTYFSPTVWDSLFRCNVIP